MHKVHHSDTVNNLALYSHYYVEDYCCCVGCI